MTDETQKMDAPVQDRNLYQAFRLMKAKDYAGAEQLIREGINQAQNAKDHGMEGVYHSAMGVLYKLTQDFKKAYKSYQQAETLLKDDHSLKIISSILLIEQFRQYETAARKLEKVLLESKDVAVIHHAQSLKAMALFLMNKKSDAEHLLRKMTETDFALLRSAANIDFRAVQLFCDRSVYPELCQVFLKKSLVLAQSAKEHGYIRAIELLLKLAQNVK